MTKMATIKPPVYGTVLGDEALFYQKIFLQKFLKVVERAV